LRLKDKIAKLQNKNERDPLELIVRVMKYFGWTLEVVKHMSIPSFMLVVETINKVEKKDRPEKK